MKLVKTPENTFNHHLQSPQSSKKLDLEFIKSMKKSQYRAILIFVLYMILYENLLLFFSSINQLPISTIMSASILTRCLPPYLTLTIFEYILPVSWFLHACRFPGGTRYPRERRPMSTRRPADAVNYSLEHADSIHLGSSQKVGDPLSRDEVWESDGIVGNRFNRWW